MSNNNMYDILGKLNSLTPADQPDTSEKTEKVYESVGSRGDIMEAVKSLEEKYQGWKKTVAAIKKGGSAEDPEAVAAAIGRKKYGKEKFQKAAAAGKKLGEAAKPDFLDLDKDGDKKEPMKKAARDKMAEDYKVKADGHHAKAHTRIDAKAKAIKLSNQLGLPARIFDLEDGDNDPEEIIHPQQFNQQQEMEEAREFKNKDEFDSLANTGDYYYTRTGGKVTKTQNGVKHERGYKKEKDDADELQEGQMKHMLHADAEKLSLKAFLAKHCHRDEDRKEMTDFWHNVNGEEELQERAKSKAQQKFMGMVYAAKKGEKPASKEVAKVARGMSKSDAEDFAKTKHKGLPQHVNESHDIRKHPIYTTQSAWDHYEKELAEQEVDKLHADHFEQQLDDSLSAVPQQTPIMDAEHELDEIARLAGLPKHKPTALVVDESECNQTMEGQECPVHGLAECGMYESIGEHGDLTGDPHEMGYRAAALYQKSKNSNPFEGVDEMKAMAWEDGWREGAAEGGMYESAGEHGDLTGDPHEMGYRAAALYQKSKNSNPFEGVDEMKAMAWEDGWREGAAEGGLEEGNEFSGALAKARAQGDKEFKVDGETYPVKEGKNKPDFADILKKAIDKRNAATASTRKEIGSRVADKDPGDQEHNLRTDADHAQTVREDINMSISANGEDDALNLIRKLAGMPVIAISADSSEESCDTCGASPCGCDDIMQEANGEHGWDNQPEEHYAPISASIPSGTDLHKSKDMVKHNYRGGDNPLAMKESAEDRLWRQYERMKTAVKK
jgi:ribosome modulation factor